MFYRTDCTRRSKFLTHALAVILSRMHNLYIHLTYINYYLLQILTADVSRILHARLILSISQLSTKMAILCVKSALVLFLIANLGK